METKYRKINGLNFEKCGDNYIYKLTDRKSIIIIPASHKGYIGRYQVIKGNGSYMNGEKWIENKIEIADRTLSEVVKRILDKIDITGYLI